MELSKNKASLISSLASKKMREKHGLFVAEGEKCVLDMCEVINPKLIVATPEWIASHRMHLPLREDTFAEASSQMLEKISSLSTPSPVLALFPIPKNQSFEIKKDKLYLLLEDVRDPGNLGTIIRTADWFGIDTIFASPSTADCYNPKTIQSTMGSLRRVRVVYTSLSELISSHPDIPSYGTFLDGENIYEKHLENRGFIIMGNEGKGISAQLREFISHRLLIPPYDPSAHGESLNVAIATGIILSQFRFGVR